MGLVFFSLSAVSYLLLFSLERKGRRGFEAGGITYWQAPKEERLRELTADVWRPRLIAYFKASPNSPTVI